MFKFYEQIHVLCAPSLCFESFGLSVREALLAQRWAIVSNRGALSQAIIEGKNGFVIDVDNEIGLLRVLSFIANDPVTFAGPSNGIEVGITLKERVETLMNVYRSIAKPKGH